MQSMRAAYSEHPRAELPRSFLSRFDDGRCAGFRPLEATTFPGMLISLSVA